MRNLIRIILGAALLVPTVACGPTGLSGGKQLNELDADDRQKACENLEDYYAKEIDEDTEHRFACAFVALFTTSVDECEVAYEGCLSQPLMTEETDENACEVTDETNCTATVAEYEDCVDEQIADLRDFADSFSCQAAVNGEITLDAEPGPACKAVAEKCPGFFDEGAGS
ncbi:MAG: hypothetical protein R3A79_31270 [Nannocystaceae bacterium]